MRGVQVPAAEVHVRVRVRAVFSVGQPSEVQQRAQGVRRQQRVEASAGVHRRGAGGRGELAGVRGGVPATGSGLRLRRPHLRPPAQAEACAPGTGGRQEGIGLLYGVLAVSTRLSAVGAGDDAELRAAAAAAERVGELQ